MPRNRNRPRLEKKPVFFAGEGASEIGYGAWLQTMLDEAEVPIHLDRYDLKGGGGHPVDLLKRAIVRMEERQRKYEEFEVRVIFVDGDGFGADVTNDQEFDRLCQQHGFMAVRQSPCFEAMLLRHLDNCHTRRPPSTQLAMTQLRAKWPDYEKPPTQHEISKHIGPGGLVGARQNEPELDAFLTAIGL